jgi:hypothetical protein
MRQAGPSHVGPGQVAVCKACAGKIRSFQTSIGQGAVIQVGVLEIGSFQVRPFQIRTVQPNPTKVRTAEIRPVKVLIVSLIEPSAVRLNDRAERRCRHDFVLIRARA